DDGAVAGRVGLPDAISTRRGAVGRAGADVLSSLPERTGRAPPRASDEPSCRGCPRSARRISAVHSGAGGLASAAGSVAPFGLAARTDGPDAPRRLAETRRGNRALPVLLPSPCGLVAASPGRRTRTAVRRRSRAAWRRATATRAGAAGLHEAPGVRSI